TVLEAGKVTRQVEARLAAAAPGFQAYEIHLGRTRVAPGGVPRALILENRVLRPDGAVSDDGRVWGTYLHRFFDPAHARAAVRAELGETGPGTEPGGVEYRVLREREYVRLAAAVRAHIDHEALVRIIEGKPL